MNEGLLSATLGLRGIPAESEVIMIKRDIDLASLTGGRLHIAHISTGAGVEAIREAKKRGVKVTAETCPHYFTLTEEAVLGYNTNAKVNPPLRTERDREVIREGLAEGVIDVIATDHAPHHRDEKLCEFDRAASGISGLETALALGLRLVEERVITLERLVALMTLRPSEILGIGKGTLRQSADADIAVIDMNREFSVGPGTLVSKGKNTPFEGMKLKGMTVMTLCKGKIYEFDSKSRVRNKIMEES
jgi:dihydroorotase